jgi:hypothetical protein
MWRRLVAAVCAELDHYTQGGPVLAPMTLLHPEYADEIFDAVHKADIELRHLVLHADPATIPGPAPMHDQADAHDRASGASAHAGTADRRRCDAHRTRIPNDDRRVRQLAPDRDIWSTNDRCRHLRAFRGP